MEPTTLAVAAGAWLWDKYGKAITDKAGKEIIHRLAVLRERVKVRKIAALAEEQAQLKEDENRLMQLELEKAAFEKTWKQINWKDAAQRYRRRVKKLYGTIQIMGMAEPVPLDDIFTDLYLLTKPTAFARFDIDRLEQESVDPDAPPLHAKRVNGLRLVVEKDNLFILGKPGAGKTTFLKYIAVKAAEQTIDKVPIFISLKHWADSGLELLPFIGQCFDICELPDSQLFVDALLTSKNTIVLFDGLDEVNQGTGQRDRQTHAMTDFVNKYDSAQTLITCRIAASDYTFEPFTYVEIADFTTKQMRKFVSNWFRKDGEKDEKTSARFLKEFEKEENKGLRDLAHTPLLLTLLCLAFDATMTFPRRRVEIYQEALDALLKRWDSSRRIKRDEVYRKLSLGHKENLLARIAAETFERSQYFIPQRELEAFIMEYVKNIPPHDTDDAADGEAILKSIESQHGIFVERAHKVYSFSHLTFQEYFTAKYVAANAAQGALSNLVNAHGAEGRWHEVFLLTTSLLPDAGQFMATLRRLIDQLLADDEKLRELLEWADKKSSSIPIDSHVARLGYLFVALYYPSRNIALTMDLVFPDTNPLDLNVARKRGLPDQIDFHPNIDLHLDLTLARAYAWAYARTHYRDLVAYRSRTGDTFRASYYLNRNYDRAFALANSLIRAGMFDVRSIVAHDAAQSFEQTSEYLYRVARDSGSNELAKELEALLIPSGTTPLAEWQIFVEGLHDLMIKHRNIGQRWDLTEMQKERLIDYFSVTSLLRECLELAVMPPDQKRAMVNSLYLPPSSPRITLES